MRTTGIEINKYFKKLLQEDQEILQYVNKSNIQPLVLKPTAFPFISFSHDEIVPNYTKDGKAYDEVIEVIAVVSNNYEESINIVSRIREMFEYRMYQDEHIYINDFTVLSITEDNISDSYVQHIVFKFDVYSKTN